MIRLIIYSLKRFAWFKRLNAKVTYEILAKRVPAADWQFMNYGYVPNTNEKPIVLPDDPKIQKYPLQMYHYLALKTQVEGKAVLEVGSGRGGGAKHIASALKPTMKAYSDDLARAMQINKRSLMSDKSDSSGSK